MQDISDTFLNAITQSHTVLSRCTYTVPGGDPVILPIESGNISMDDSSNTRRTGTVGVIGDSADYEALATPGTIIRVDHGLHLNGGDELVPVFTGELNKASQSFGSGAGAISLPLVDFGARIAGSDFTLPFAPIGTLTRPQAIAAIISDAMPAVVVSNTSTDTGLVGADKVWTGSRWSAIADLTADGGTQAFFLPDGSFLIRDMPTLGGRPVWQLAKIIKSAARARPIDQLYNTVVVSPSQTDGSQMWATQVVAITDPNHPRYPGKIGVKPLFITSATIGSVTDAQNAGLAKLARVQGTTETLDLQTISNPALEGGDQITVGIPRVRGEAGNVFQHLTDSFTLDLVGGSMQLGTRSQPLVTS